MARLKTASRETVIKKLKNRLQNEPRISFAYLYGSFLKRKDPCDIDVAIFLENPKDLWQETQIIGARLEKALDYKAPVDAHALNQASPSFAFEVMNSGQLFFERDREARLTWEAHTLSLYQDIKPMLDFYDQKYLSQ